MNGTRFRGASRPDSPISLATLRYLVSAVRSVRGVLLTAALASTLSSFGCTSDDEDASNTRSYRWSGTVWGSTDNDGAIACFGPILASDPPAGCEGWPIAGFDWSTAPNVDDRSRPDGSGSPGHPIRTAFVTLVGHPDGRSFVLDASPTAVDASQPTGPICTEMTGKRGPPVSLRSAHQILVGGQAEGRVWLTGPGDGGGDGLVAREPAHPDPLLLTILVNDEPTRTWIREHLTGIEIRVCGLLREG